MSAVGELLIFLMMGLGIVGVLLPVLPGLWLTLIAAFVWSSWDGGGSRWGIFAIQCVLFALGTAASILIPASTTRGPQSRRTLTIAGICAVIGFFVVPIIGLPLGFGIGVFGASIGNGMSLSEASIATRDAMRAYGTSVLVQVVCGMGIAALFIVGLVIT